MSHKMFAKIAGTITLLASFIFCLFCGFKQNPIIYILFGMIILLADKIKIKHNFEYNKLFMLSIIALWLIIGVFIPTNLIASSPNEFIFPDANPIAIFINVTFVLFGLIIFWPSCLYCFLNIKYKKIFSITVCLALFLSLLNMYYIKLPYAILSSILTFDTSKAQFENYIIPSKIPYYLIALCIIFVVYKLITFKKAKIINIILSEIIIICILISSGNFIKITKSTNIYYADLNKQTNNNEKYIKLSKTRKNVLIIFIDRGIGSYLPIIFNEKKYLKEKFKGFTYYPNTLSFAQYTVLGYLPITGGYEYTPFEMDKRNGLFQKKYYEAMTVLPAIFSQNHYNTTVINPINNPMDGASWRDIKNTNNNDKHNYYQYYKAKNIKVAEIPSALSINLQKNTDVTSSIQAIHNFILFCILNVIPASEREALYDNGLYHNFLITRNFDSKHFYKNYAELFYLPNLTEFSENNNTFTIYNNALPHYSMHLNYPNYELSGINDDSYVPPKEINDNGYYLTLYHVNLATLRLLGEYFDFLRKNNAYNNTRIIITADHGLFNIKNTNISNFLIDNFAPYNPLLIVKDFNSNSPFKQSNEFMTNADVTFIASRELIKKLNNPYTNEVMSDKYKKNGIIIKHDRNWYPSEYVNKNKILNNNDVFNYVHTNPQKQENWKTNISYKEALNLLNNTKTKNP